LMIQGRPLHAGGSDKAICYQPHPIFHSTC
jgi:hypothetical protein